MIVPEKSQTMHKKNPEICLARRDLRCRHCCSKTCSFTSHTFCFHAHTHTHAYTNTLQHTTTDCNTPVHGARWRGGTRDLDTLQHTATHCNTLQHTTARCNTPARGSRWRGGTRDPFENTCRTQEWVTLCNTLQHTATHCNTLQHTATQCSTL